MEDLKYPIGPFVPSIYDEDLKEERIADIRFLPNALEAALQNLDHEQLHTPYRDGGWTVHQVVHHVADSHINAYLRFKLGYTEPTPTIKPYDENAWIGTSDVTDLPVNISITLLYALHQRWAYFLDSLTADDLQRTIYHPERKEEQTLWMLLDHYAWHGRHHTAHITALRSRNEWY